MRTMILAALIPLAACGNFGGDGDSDSPGVAGSGSGNTRSYQVADFTGVELRGPDDVDVRVGSGFSVRAEGDEATLGKLKIERVGDTLRVGRIRQNGISWSSGKGVTVYVTMPRMTAASLAGSGDLSVDRVEGGGFKGSIAGSGSLALGAIEVSDADLSIAGSGNISVGGSAGKLGVDIAGSGDVNGSRLKAQSANVSIAGSGGVRAAVDGAAKVSILGSGDVDLGPRAKCSVSKMGSGSVTCGG
jgi:Putative auto-transporter adhesin, head GIN domain